MKRETCETCGGTGEKINHLDLRFKREQSGFTQGQFAARMHVAASYLCDLEQGRRDWNASLLAKFNAALRNHKPK